MSDIRVKICGLTTRALAEHAIGAGADYIGLVFFPPSPRSITPDQAKTFLEGLPNGVTRVALLVDAEDALVDAVASSGIDMLQLHGHETPERVTELKARTGFSVMKAIGIREAADLAEIDRYARVADQLLVDAKPPKDATRPGGNALTFDWDLLAERQWDVPWMLAGGLTDQNVADAIRQTGAMQVDISSAVESAPGVKDPAMVEAFIKAAKAA